MGRQIEWAMWANEQAIASCLVMFTGGVLGVSSLLLQFPHVRWWVSVYAVFVSPLILCVEYARSKPLKGRYVWVVS